MDMKKEEKGYYTQTRPEMLNFIPIMSKRVLEAGCGAGLFGSLIKEKLHGEVWGIEIDAAAAMEARKRLDKVIVGDISKLIDEIPKNYFDCIVFNDVLEHCIDPAAILAKSKDMLTDHGTVVCSLPNIRYFFALKPSIWRIT